jgi:GTP-binding protein EngB required for normal cell division
MRNSKEAGRSFNTVTTVLLGQSGHGKSSTVNHLLGVPLATTSSKMSETRATTEFKLVAPEPSLGVSNLSLSLVDTPGFGDTEGLAQDACNLVSISKFLAEGQEGRVFPNMILIVFNASEKRFDGKNSAFYKALREVGKLGIVDKRRPNVILVLTHICSLPTKTAEEKVNAISGNLIAIIKETLDVTAEAVCLENEYEDYGLEKEGDQTKLKIKNGEMQPRNLFIAIILRLQENGDDLALMAFKKFFGKFSGFCGRVIVSDIFFNIFKDL